MARGQARNNNNRRHLEVHLQRDASEGDISDLTASDAREQLRLALEALKQADEELRQANNNEEELRQADINQDELRAMQLAEAELTAMKIAEAKLAAAKRRRNDIKDQVNNIILACMRDARSFAAKGEGAFSEILMSQCFKNLMLGKGYDMFLLYEKSVIYYNNGRDYEPDKLIDEAEYLMAQQAIYEILMGGAHHLVRQHHQADS